jgi:bifunctional DNA-binding transcriptional regulator/antitoxin component of YhaV-PrlF toxin-antitoxin module
MPGKTQRIIQTTGASRTVSLPRDWLRALGLDAKDRVDLLYSTIVIIKRPDTKLDSDLVRNELKVMVQLEGERRHE